MILCYRPGPSCLALALALSLSGCGSYVVARTLTGAGSLAVGGAAGAVRLTGTAVGATAEAVAGLGRADESGYE
ncbi:hypothetical protein [Hoeflea sp. YIM 152468]|uniref:hypothetical protein n=1 Tax=Hoeflea sp. YIM 152468 TaxID=3031759 RepID=UPI0023DC2204|nr:hypothetical protein [Hoeflea sp. YIM 152468]